MARLGRRGFLAVAVIFHLIYAWSIFDIYFVSPIVSGMRPFGVDAPEPPARRLVLFVGDGLRADKAFQSFPDPSPPDDPSYDAETPRPLAPFLRSRVLSHGTFGVSHTRVPTESRPGHVALIAGLYEDVSAVMTGWKLNPVNFDSVFNRSRHTWSWGSPDILPMFKEGAVPGRIDADCYGAEEEDFTAEATKLDTWVFDKVKAMFEEAKKNETLHAALQDDKVVFFLHLLGLDTTGHAFRPYSKEYLHNIKIVDQGVQEITELIERFYGDGKTAFVFTADHGMSDWGSHGDGHPDNTRTPLIAWGSGVAKPVTVKKGIAPGHEDEFSSDWGLSHVQRHDVAQADVAALMAYLAGLEFPVNSVGELPLSYLDAEPKAKAEALLVNARGILEMYQVKEQEKMATEVGYKAFPDFAGDVNSPENRIKGIQATIDSGDYDKAITDCTALVQTTLQAIRYLQTYDWLFLRTLVTLGYIGFVAFAFTTIIDIYVLHSGTPMLRTTASTVAFSSILVALYSFLFIQHSRPTYYAYAFFPVFFWEDVFARRNVWVEGRKILLGHLDGTKAYLGFFAAVLLFAGVLEALAQSYFHREMYTICYLLGMAWPASYGFEFMKQHVVLIATWALSCAMMSTFTLLPAIKTESINLILVGGFLMFAVGALYLLLEKSILLDSKSAKGELAETKPDSLSRTILGVQVGLIALSMLVTRSSVTSIQARQGLPLGTQVVGWIVLVASLTVPFLHGLRPNNHYLHRLTVIFLTFAPMFIILTISYEGLFYFAFCTLVLTWVRLEHHVYRHRLATAVATVRAANGSAAPPSNGHALKSNGAATSTQQKEKEISGAFRTVTLADARISLFFLFLLNSAFFSTGNIASISSFSLDAVYRLIPVFDPFSQGALLLLKIMVPFVVISANLGILNRLLGLGQGVLGMVGVVMGDWLTVRFFWLVKDEGSWLDIGESITKFVIASMLGVFVAGLEGVGEVFVGGVEVATGGDDNVGATREEKAK
ncbi:GPI ethanolamine phosphate transferas-like protein [Rhizodiscina lignyota]|uniref:GPI ethanolamine phosphate transferase 1 n=1 Tax=Rhizodiscina lignyota TaxID=1504668 RepID=A0A9P4IBT8_9PEZI|nr:GPI ethanolamine phosphate transferas-like protein [Rhizodiscina lignyota]